MVCEAESRQVEEYQRERQRIGALYSIHESLPITGNMLSEQEHEALRSQIAELKVALEHAQTERKRMIEYDSIAEKINTLPARDELLQCVGRFMFTLGGFADRHRAN